MAAFFGLDLFDPSASDEPATSTDDSDLLLSASELEQRERKIPPRSKTAVDLRAEASKYPIGTVRIRRVEIVRIKRDVNMFIMIPFPAGPAWHPPTARGTSLPCLPSLSRATSSTSSS